MFGVSLLFEVRQMREFRGCNRLSGWEYAGIVSSKRVDRDLRSICTNPLERNCQRSVNGMSCCILEDLFRRDGVIHVKVKATRQRQLFYDPLIRSTTPDAPGLPSYNFSLSGIVQLLSHIANCLQRTVYNVKKLDC